MSIYVKFMPYHEIVQKFEVNDDEVSFENVDCSLSMLKKLRDDTWYKVEVDMDGDVVPSMLFGTYPREIIIADKEGIKKRIYRAILKYIAKKIAVQGDSHYFMIREYYEIMNDAAQNEFNEENQITTEFFLYDTFMDSLKQREAIQRSKR